MSTQWGLVVEETDGGGDDKTYAAGVLELHDGTRDEALVRLEELARGYVPQHPMRVSRSLLFRTGDGFLLVSEGSTRNYGCRFTLAELLHDSAEAEREAAARRAAEAAERAQLKAAEAKERAERKAAEKAAKRGQRGSWWSR